MTTNTAPTAALRRPATSRWWWPIPLYPAAFPLAIIAVVWGESEISLLELVRPAAAAIVVSATLALVLSGLAGDRRLGGIAASALTVALVVDRVEAQILLMLVAVLVVVVGRLPGARDIRFLSAAARGLSLIAVVALLASGISAVGRPGFGAVMAEPFLAPPGPAERPAAPAGAPDIFVYLIDGYPGATASAQAPWFDASAFPSGLAERGFTVHDDARTNYLITRLVLPTMFEGRHIPDIAALAAPFGPDQSVDARRMRSVLEHAAGLANIRAAGYDVVWISSAWSHLDIRDVDRWVQAPGPSELEVALLRDTGAGQALEAVDPNGFGRVMRDRVEAAYATAASIAAEPHDRPRFVFVHVPAPHPPTVYLADGSPTDDSPELSWNANFSAPEDQALRRERTFAHVEAIGRITIAGVDALRSASTTPPVVVVFSDHGTDIGWDPNTPLTSDLAERTSSFLATLTPGRPELFREPTTPVNIIGTLTNAYMGTNVPRQPDVTYAYDGSLLNVVPIQTTPGD